MMVPTEPNLPWMEKAYQKAAARHSTIALCIMSFAIFLGLMMILVLPQPLSLVILLCMLLGQ